jgi:FkbM family methyltransferase
MDHNLVKGRIISGLGRIPVLGDALRRLGHVYAEGSVVTIRSGLAAGMRWKRHHRFLNGFWIGQYELEVQRAFRELISPGDIVYDIGAHAGFFSLIASRLTGPSGRVFAFDPNPECATSVREQIELNGLSQCEVVEAAIGHKNGIMGFRLEGPYSRLDDEEHFRVPIVTLDTFVQGHPRPDLVKMDVEGAEAAVLRGARDITSAKYLIEIHGERSGIEVVAILKDRNYRLLGLDLKETASPEKEHYIIAVPQ